MKNVIITSILFSSFAFAANTTSVTKVKKKKSKKSKLKTSLTLGAGISQVGNIDSLVANSNTAEDIIVNKINAGLKLKYKVSKKLRLSTNTKISASLINDLNKNGETFVKADEDINENQRSVSLSQSLAASYKFNKKFSSNISLEAQDFSGYSIEQNFSNDEYILTNDSFTKYSATVGSRFKITKKLIFNGLYRFSQFDHDSEYTTLAANQGTETRRVHSLGSLLLAKLNKKTNIALSAQFDRTFYKDKNALNTDNTFKITGLSTASRLEDLKTKLKVNISNFAFDYNRSDREDLINDAETSNSQGVNLSYKVNLAKNKITLTGGYSIKEYKNQLSNDSSEKREDKSLNIKAAIDRNIAKSVSINAFVNRIDTDSNNIFGDISSNNIGIGLKSNF